MISPLGITIGLFALGYFIYWPTRSIKHKYAAIYSRAIGTLSFGIMPGVVVFLFSDLTLKDVGVTRGNFMEQLLWTVVISIILIIAGTYSAKRPAYLKKYPEIRVKIWTRKLFLIDALSWTLYIIGYEFTFRGLLLFTSIPLIGVANAVILNTVFYAFAHLPKNMRETFACIPYGAALSIVTVMTGTIWVATITHVILVLNNDLVSIKYNKDMEFEKNFFKFWK